jgi:hypothetical protein
VSARTTSLRVGLRLLHDGEQFTVTELAGRMVLLAGARGRLRQVEIGWLLAHPTTSVVGVGYDAQACSAVVLDGLEPDERAMLTTRVRHVQEIVTGFWVPSSWPWRVSLVRPIGRILR